MGYHGTNREDLTQRRRDPQAGRLFRKTTKEETPFLFIGTIIIVIFWDDLPEGGLAAVVGGTVLLTWLVNRHYDRKYKRTDNDKESDHA